MSSFNKSSSWNQTFGWVIGSLGVLVVVLYVYDALKPPFFSTISPDNTYTVNLYGQKERPSLLTVEVGAVVLKNGQDFWPYQTLHSGDSMDLSFELGWPDHRWIGNNVLQFYRQDDISVAKGVNELILFNDSTKSIEQLEIITDHDKFLAFDLPSKSELPLTLAPSKGDSMGISVSGRFEDGQGFAKTAVFDETSTEGPATYRVAINGDGIDLQRYER